MDNYITGTEDNPLSNDKNITYLKHDVRNRFDTKVRVDYGILAAGLASPVFYLKYPLETLEVARLGTKHML